MKEYRDGPTGALMDEYERAAIDFKILIASIPQNEFEKILDSHTEDPDCRSVKTITNHVVRAGYGYANYIRKQFNDPWVERKEDYEMANSAKAIAELEKMLAYTIETLQDKGNLTFEEVMKNIIKTAWGQSYDFEQLLEHAIVHVLRHRRQIERLLNKNS